MKFFTSAVALISLFAASAFAAAVDTTPDLCKPGTLSVVNSTVVDGKPLTHQVCESIADTTEARRDEGTTLTKRNIDLCGAPCTTYCSTGIGGPNPNDCVKLANQYKNAGTFIASPGYTYFWNYGSCDVYMNNNSGQDLYYCYDTGDWAGIVKYVAQHCQATHGNYNGGTCRFYDSTSIAQIGVQTV